MGCTLQDPSQRHHDCITRSSIECIECNFSEMLNKVNLYMVYELTKSYIADRFSAKEIDESYPFYSPESYLTNTVWCRKIKENLISNYMREETYLFSLDFVKNYNEYSCIRQFQLLINRLWLAYNAIHSYWFNVFHSYWFITVGFGCKRQL